MGKSEKKNTKLLNAKRAEQMLRHLEKWGNKSKVANKLGITKESISYWLATNKIPQYCEPYLETIELKERLVTVEEQNKVLRKVLAFSIEEFGDIKEFRDIKKFSDEKQNDILRRMLAVAINKTKDTEDLAKDFSDAIK